MKLKVAILFQSKKPPIIDGIVKPMKEGGYSDSGADIALALKHKQVELVTPFKTSNIINDFDWVFADTQEGIDSALRLGANTFWLNTVLYGSHPIINFKNKNISVVGQQPQTVEIFDDKFYTNNILRSNALPVPNSVLITKKSLNIPIEFDFPVVIKPIRGRGSQGVKVVENQVEYIKGVQEIIDAKVYGNSVMVEAFLPGKEITITIMPAGSYLINGYLTIKENYWALPAVERFNHDQNIAPYNGIVAVIENSKLTSSNELNDPKIQQASKNCEIAAALIGVKAPIRIDCRQNFDQQYYLFDLNLKPNMTGPSRVHRKNQDSLTTIAAQGMGWSYLDLIENILHQKWLL